MTERRYLVVGPEIELHGTDHGNDGVVFTVRNGSARIGEVTMRYAGGTALLNVPIHEEAIRAEAIGLLSRVAQKVPGWVVEHVMVTGCEEDVTVVSNLNFARSQDARSATMDGVYDDPLSIPWNF